MDDSDRSAPSDASHPALLTRQEERELALKIEVAQQFYQLEAIAGQDVLWQSLLAFYRLSKLTPTWLALAKHLELPYDLEISDLMDSARFRESITGPIDHDTLLSVTRNLRADKPKQALLRIQHLSTYIRLIPINQIADRSISTGLSLVNIREFIKDRTWRRRLTEGENQAHRAYQAIASEGERALHLFTESNMGLVKSTVANFHTMSSYETLDRRDAVQSGYLGLMEAAQRFNFRYGRFSTYAVPWIKRLTMENFREQLNSYYLPTEFVRLTAQIEEVTLTLHERLNRPPTLDEIGSETGLSPSRVRQVIQHTNNVSHIGVTPADFDIDFIDHNIISPETSLDIKSDMETVLSAMNEHLPLLTRHILVYKWGVMGLPQLTTNELATKYHISPLKVRHIASEGERRLREILVGSPRQARDNDPTTMIK